MTAWRHRHSGTMLAAALLTGSCFTTAMPGQSHQGALPPPTADETELATELQRHVQKLAGEIGERNTRRNDKLEAAASYIEAELRRHGYQTGSQPFQADGVTVRNIDAELRGTGPAVIVGAHYDSAPGTPGANDNASGTAATLILARRLSQKPPRQTIRFVFWVNEEPPFFQTDLMGSRVYARRCRERKERIAGVLSLETLGYYTDAPGTQSYPSLIRDDYPDRGNFVSFVSDRSSKDLLERTVTIFRRMTPFPAEGLSAPGWIEGVGWSDHWSFWQEGYPGLMVTDTAPFRYRHYHGRKDLPEQLVYDRLARVVVGLEGTIRELAR